MCYQSKLWYTQENFIKLFLFFFWKLAGGVLDFIGFLNCLSNHLNLQYENSSEWYVFASTIKIRYAYKVISLSLVIHCFSAFNSSYVNGLNLAYKVMHIETLFVWGLKPLEIKKQALRKHFLVFTFEQNKRTILRAASWI